MFFWRNFSLRKFKNLCVNYNFKYEITDTCIYIKTGYSNWIITTDYELKRIKLFHSNHLWNNKKRQSQEVPGYHFQRKYTLNYDKDGKILNRNVIIDILKYIRKHDENKHVRDFKNFQRRNSRLNYLFSQI